MAAAAQIVIDRVNHLYCAARTRGCWRSIRSLEVANRQFVLALLGPSGLAASQHCSTCIVAYCRAILIDGQNSGPGPASEGIVFQHFALFP